LLLAGCDHKISSFIYYIDQRLLSNKKERIAKSLAQDLSGKQVMNFLSTSVESATGKIFEIRQKTLNYLLMKK
jgi:hypothetical protein